MDTDIFGICSKAHSTGGLGKGNNMRRHSVISHLSSAISHEELSLPSGKVKCISRKKVLKLSSVLYEFN